MLITFSCPAYASITMFGEPGVKLIQRMGHSGSVPGALLADDVPAALARLQAAIAADTPRDATASDQADADSEPAVSLAHRALPLTQLLEAAAAQHCDVLWDRAN